MRGTLYQLNKRSAGSADGSAGWVHAVALMPGRQRGQLVSFTPASVRWRILHPWPDTVHLSDRVSRHESDPSSRVPHQFLREFERWTPPYLRHA